MVKKLQVKNILRWLVLLTYISATVLIVLNNKFDKLRFIMPLILVLFFTNYFREYYLYEKRKKAKYVVASIIIEMLLIITIGFFDKSGINTLYYYVMISSMAIMYPFIYSIPTALVFIVFEFCREAVTKGIDITSSSMLSLIFSYVVSSAFVMGMSLLVRMQVKEKEKQAHINAELEQAYKRLMENSSAVQKLAVEEERTRMAREIHDTLAHTLTTLIVQLEACKKLAALDPSRLPSELEKAQALSRSGFNDIKRSIKALRPQIMEDKSFVSSLRSVFNEVMENTEVHIALFNLLPQELKLSNQLEIGLFRAIQESITNSIRHGQAAEIKITLKQENGLITATVEDNGIGCTNIKKGFGLTGIRERIEALNGNVEFSSSYQNGFKTVITIPMT